MTGQSSPTQLLMHLPSLKNLSPPELPTGYSCRSFRAGDEAGWQDVIEASFGKAPGQIPFDRTMQQDPAFRPERVWFVIAPGGSHAATASAWYRPQYGADTGYIHYVGTHPDHAGRRLGAAVTLAALQQMVRENRTDAVLETDDFRIPALKTYLRLGFRPAMRDDTHRARWEGILRSLGLLDDYRQDLLAPCFPVRDPA
ncbi:MAG: GNAT family N-acetyltransferase [Planctomycetes bacterium]|nr:GNAT family N-acetyltransferase [Planctomycetota bacterium]